MLEVLSLSFFDNISIFLIIILICFSFVIILKNKKLREEINDLKEENNLVYKNNQKLAEDIRNMTNVTKIDSNNVDKVLSKAEKKENKNVSSFVSDNKRNIDIKKNFYSKNVIHDKPKVVSPVTLECNDDISFDANDFVKKNKSIKKEKVHDNYLEKISHDIAQEIKPKTIKLTEYEQKQEDSAIISYKELLSIKDNISVYENDDETVDFIEELKNFRNSLN